MRKTILVFCCCLVSDLAAKRPAVSEDNKEQMWAAEKLQKRLEREVAEKYKGEIKSDMREGPCGTLLVRAYAQGAYPGTGVMSAIVAKNAVAYGKRGERDFADFARAQGWLKSAPDVTDYMRILDFAEFDAVVMNLSHLEAPKLGIEGDRLVLHFIRGFMPNGAYPTEVIVDKTGGVKVVQLPEQKKGR